LIAPTVSLPLREWCGGAVNRGDGPRIPDAGTQAFRVSQRSASSAAAHPVPAAVMA
jgi:hypothetical protein